MYLKLLSSPFLPFDMLVLLLGALVPLKIDEGYLKEKLVIPRFLDESDSFESLRLFCPNNGLATACREVDKKSWSKPSSPWLLSY